MKYENLESNGQIPKIGFGTWGIGGDTRAIPSTDAQSLSVLQSALELGYTHFDTAELYSAGHAEELLGQAIRQSGIRRESLFITTKVIPSHLGYTALLRACENSLRRLQMDAIDLYLIHWLTPSANLEKAFSALNRLVREGKVRHVGVSNFRIADIQKAERLSETPLLTNQVPYSLSDRSYVENGVLEYCQSRGILLTAYSPVDKGGLRVAQTLQKIADAHHANPYQIALAWLVAQPKVIAIPRSSNPVHQKDNLDAPDITLSDEEMAQFNRLD